MTSLGLRTIEFHFAPIRERSSFHFNAALGNAPRSEDDRVLFQFRLAHCLIALFLCFLFLLTAPFGALSLGTTIMNVVRLADRRRRLADTTRD